MSCDRLSSGSTILGVARGAILALSLVALACDRGELEGDDASAVGVARQAVTGVNTVDSSVANASALDTAFQRKAFRGYGRNWVFYSNGTNLVFRSSTDGVTWGSATTVRAAPSASSFSIAFDGTYVHYAYSPQTGGGALMYRRGLPTTGGTITWSAEVTAKAGTTGYYYYRPTVAVSAQGLAWVGLFAYKSASYRYQWVLRSNYLDGTLGTWTTESVPLPNTNGITANLSIVPVALRDGRMLVLLGQDGSQVRSALYTGSAWIPDVGATIGKLRGNMLSVAADGDDVHLAYVDSRYALSHVKWTYHPKDTVEYGTWGDETILATGSADSSPALTLNRGAGELHCVWRSPASAYVFLQKKLGLNGLWDDAATSWQQTDDAISPVVAVPESVAGGGAAVYYRGGTASPYKLQSTRLSFAGKCGDAVVDPGETCDLGDGNGPGSCCSARCTAQAGSSLGTLPSTSSYPGHPGLRQERSGFYAATRHWVFQSDFSGTVSFTSSLDAKTWAAPSAMRTAETLNPSSGGTFSVHFDGTYVHYAFVFGSPDSTNGNLRYRRGTPNASGTITWSNPEQFAGYLTSHWYERAVVTTDTNGYPWIAVGIRNADDTRLAIAYKATTANGLFSPDYSSGVNFSGSSTNPWDFSIVPLQSGRMLAVWCPNLTTAYVIYSRVWRGTAWAGSERYLFNVSSPSVVAHGDEAHLSYQDGSYPYQGRYAKFTYNASDTQYGGTWESQAAVAGKGAIGRNAANGDVYVFWHNDYAPHHLYYLRRAANGTWDSSPRDLGTLPETVQIPSRIQVYERAGDNRLGVLTRTYNVSHAQYWFGLLDVGGCSCAAAGTCPQAASCGNSVIETGEDCDLGTANGAKGSCCSDRCTRQTANASTEVVPSNPSFYESVGATQNRKGFHGYGRHWLFYSDGTNMVYKTSTDGVTWGSPTTVRRIDEYWGAGYGKGRNFSIWFDGTYVHYAYAFDRGVANPSPGYPLVYRRGTPTTSGTITWGNESEAVPGVAGYARAVPSITVDSNGYPWIAFRTTNHVTQGTLASYAQVIKSSTNNGTFTPQAGFAGGLPLDGPMSDYYTVVAVPLRNGRVVVVWNPRMLGYPAWSRLWTGTSWGGQRTVTADTYLSSITAVSHGDEAHVVYMLHGGTSKYRYTKFSYNSSDSSYFGAWDQAIDLATFPLYQLDYYPALGRNAATGDLYLVWQAYPIRNVIFYMRRSAGGAWDANLYKVDQIEPESYLLSPNSQPSLAVYEQVGNKVLGMMIDTGQYNVRFAQLDAGGVCPRCGDGVVAAGEQCDEGVGNGKVGSCCTLGCNLLATGAVCRPALNAQCDTAEVCDGTSGECPLDVRTADGTTCTGGQCRAGSCQAVGTCGNGILEAGEACDLGAQNGQSGSCCKSDCQFEGAFTVCRPGAGLCDEPEYCTGVSPTCPLDSFKSMLTQCRASTGACDPAEYCTGSGATCPSDFYYTNCQCTSGACCDTSAMKYKSAGTLCRAVAGPCDLAEYCTGGSASCPTDTFASSATVCRTAAGSCDTPEACSGTSASCPTDGFKSSATVCRASTAACDPQEACTGSAAACPADTNNCTGQCSAGACCNVATQTFKAAGTECRAAVNACDMGEACTGASAECPADFKQPDNSPCAGGTCQAGVCVASSGKANGAVCGLSSECTSGFCVDGVCCGSACSGTCQACAQAKTGSPNGTCANVTSGTNPDGECPSGQMCNGSGACTVYTPPTPPVCVGGHPPDSLEDKGGGGNAPDGVQGAVGTFGHGLEIAVPVFHSIQPRLALGYNSASPHGSAGVGWNLGGAAVIERAAPGRGAPRYDATDIYLLGGQELLPCQAGSPSPSCTSCPSGYTCYSTRIESFDRIGTSGGTWTVWSKAGVTATLSPTFTTTAGTFRWVLTKVESKVSGSVTNTVDYTWWCDGSSPILDCYLGTITYNGNTVQMYWESRPDPSTFATGASMGQTRYRLRSVVVKVGSTVARAYALAYATATTGGSQSLLTSVTHYGRDTAVDSNGAVTSGQSLPAETYAWAQPGGLSGWQALPSQSYGVASNGTRKTLGDVNGDGRTDYCYQANDGSRSIWCMLGTPTGLAANVYFGTMAYALTSGVWGLADVNGDGKDDWVYKPDGQKKIYVKLAKADGSGFGTDLLGVSYASDIAGSNSQFWFQDFNRDGKADFAYNAAGTPTIYAHLSKLPTAKSCAVSLDCESGYDCTDTWCIPTTTEKVFNSATTLLTRSNNVAGNDSNNRTWFADVDGDGCPDHVYQKLDTEEVHVLLSNWCRGTQSYSSDTNWRTHAANESFSQMADVNGDGKADHVYVDGSRNVRVLLSQGTSFATEQVWGTLGYAPAGDGNGRLWWLQDIDGDGVVDLVYRANGSTSFYWRRGTGLGLGAESWLFTMAYDAAGEDGANAHWFADVTGDGRADFFYRKNGSTNLYGTLSQGAIGLLMTGVTNNGMGGSVSVGYGPTAAYANTNRPPNRPVVTHVQTSWGGTTTYSYAGGLFDWMERVPLGFRYVKKTLPCITGEAACPYSESWFSQDYATINKPERTDIRTGSGVLVASTQDSYQLSGDGAATPYKAMLTGTWAFAYDGSGTGCSAWPCAYGTRSYVARAYDAYGNRTEENTYGDYDKSGDERTKSYVYRPNTSLYIVALPAVERIFQGIGTGGTLIDEGQTLYDGSGTWDASPTVGNVTKVRRLVTTGSYLELAKEYDAYGNLTAEIKTLQSSPLVQQKTSYVYDTTYHVFPVEERSPLYQVDTRHKTLRTFDAVCAAATQITDPNGLVTTQEYDAFCRVTRVTKPTGEFETTSYVGFGDAAAQYVHLERPAPGGVSGNLWSRSYKDGGGRTYKTVTRGPAAQGDVVAETVYNARGRVAAAAAPRFGSESAAWTTHSYDALDRLVRTTHPDGTFATRIYGLNVITVVDECGGQTSEYRNGLGQVTQRRQWRNGAALDTFFQYNAKDQISAAIDPKGNRYAITYNALGQKETVTDPDSGTTTYSYDEAGRITEVRNALDQRIVTQYDVGDRKTRVTLKRADGSIEDTITVTYDEARAGYYNVGAATTTTDSTGSIQSDYDVGGRAAKVQRVLFGTTYTTESGFDSAGRTLWTTYPDGDTLGTAADPVVYDELGKPRVIPGYMTDATYNARGYLASLTRADGTITSYTYDPNRLWLKRIRTTRGATLIQDLDYTINAVGQVAQVVSPFANETWTYGYDSAGFLTSAVSSNASHSQSWTYDDTGNILTATRPEGGGTWTYAYNSAHGPASVRPHAVVTAGSNAYSYDAAGNMITGAGRTFTWSVNGKPTAITTPTGSFTFAYDGNGGRVMKVNGAVTTYYPFPGYEVTSGVVTKYIGFGAVKLAKKVEGVKYFLHTDHQGSVRVITDGAGVEVQRLKHRPYGERLSTATAHAESLGFRGQRQDETGLIYMNVRYYDPQLGRFISADPAVPSSSTVGLNRYAYAGNDPVGNSENGNSFSSLFKFLKGIVIGMLISMALVAMGMTNPWLIAFWSGFIQGTGEALVAGAPLKDALKSGLVGGAMSVATKAVTDFVVQGLQMLKAAMKQFQAVASGASMGGEGINSYDFNYEGNYVVETDRQANPYEAARIGKEAAGAHIKATHAGVFLAGSNQSLAEAFKDARAWGAQVGYESVVLVYAPQRAGIFTYIMNLTGNSAARNTLNYLYRFAARNGITLHVAGHSWGAWIAASVAITHGAPTSNVKLDLYNVATMPQGWSMLRRALNTWENKVTLITGTQSGLNDVTHITLDQVYGKGGGVTNPAVKIEWRNAGHGMTAILGGRNVNFSLDRLRAHEFMH